MIEDSHSPLGDKKIFIPDINKINNNNLPLGNYKNNAGTLFALIHNYLNLLNRYLPYYVYYNSFFRLGLFLPRQLFKPQFYSYKYKKTNIIMNTIPAFNLREFSPLSSKGSAPWAGEANRNWRLFRTPAQIMALRRNGEPNMSQFSSSNSSKRNAKIKNGNTRRSTPYNLTGALLAGRFGPVLRRKILPFISKISLKKIIRGNLALIMTSSDILRNNVFKGVGMNIYRLRSGQKSIIKKIFMSNSSPHYLKIKGAFPTLQENFTHSSFANKENLSLRIKNASQSNKKINVSSLRSRGELVRTLADKSINVKATYARINDPRISRNLINKVLIDNNFLPLKPITSKETNRAGVRSAPIENKLRVSSIWQVAPHKINKLLNVLLKKGDAIINKLNSLILEKQTLINNNKVNKLLLNLNLQYGTAAALLVKTSNHREAPTKLSLVNTSQINKKIFNTKENFISDDLDILNYQSKGYIGEQLKSQGLSPRTSVLNQYLKSISIYNMKKKGILIYYKNLISYNFVKSSLSHNNKLIFKIYKLLQATFKSMYCLISKPIFVVTPDKLVIKLFYFLFIPNILKFKKIISFAAVAKRGKANSSYRLFLADKKKTLIKTKKQYSKFRKLKQNVRIKLRNLSNIALIKVFSNKFKILSIILSKLFKKPIELDLTRMHYPYNDSNILVNLLGIMINKIRLRMIIRRLFKKATIKNLNKMPRALASSLNSIAPTHTGINAGVNTPQPLKEDASPENNNWKDSVNIPAFLSGIKIKVGGRLLTQSVVPRQTVKITQRGATQRGKINFLDVARYTRKNKRGAFSITIKSGQNIF